jgi:hypothetical protein
MSTSYQQKVAVRFGEFELDHSGELGAKGSKIKLQEQPLQILRSLMEQRGEIVTREELRQKIWPSDTFVDFDHGINNAIKRLREALGDPLRPRVLLKRFPAGDIALSKGFNCLTRAFAHWRYSRWRTSRTIQSRNTLLKE